MSFPNDERTNVSTSLSIYGIREIDTIYSRATIACSLKLYWFDSRLTWEREEFGGIETTRVSTNPEYDGAFIWTPDIESYQNVNSKLYDGFRRPLAQVRHDGRVYLSLHGSITVSINMILANYPYDE